MTKWLPDAVIPQVTAGLVAALGLWLKAVGDRRNKAKQYESLLSRARSEIETLTSWLQAYRLVATEERSAVADARAAYDLELAYSRILAAQAAFARAAWTGAKELSPHYVLAALALILFFSPTGAVAATYSALTRQAVRANDFDLARRRSRRVVTWFWISVVCGGLVYVALVAASPSGVT